MKFEVNVTIGLDQCLLLLLASFMAGGDIVKAQQALKEATDAAEAALKKASST